MVAVRRAWSVAVVEAGRLLQPCECAETHDVPMEFIELFLGVFAEGAAVRGPQQCVCGVLLEIDQALAVEPANGGGRWRGVTVSEFL